MRDLDDYKTSISFLEAELSEINFKQLEVNALSQQVSKQSVGDSGLLDCEMLENGEETNNVWDRTNRSLNTSKSHEVSALNGKFLAEVKELREQITGLDSKNKKYLEIIGMTASEQQENMKQQVEAAQEALTFTKRVIGQGVSSQDMEILEELEGMLEIQQKEMQTYQDQISVLTDDL